MTILMVIIFIGILLLVHWWDDKQFSKRISTFEVKARDYMGMYNDILNFIKNGDEEDSQIETLEWTGMVYTAFAKIGEDEKSFYSLMKQIGEDVLCSYKSIGEKNINDLEDEDAQYINELYHNVLALYNQARYQCWLKK